MERIKKQNVILLEARFILLTSTLPPALFLEDFSFASIFFFFFFLLHFLSLSLCGSPREQLASPSRMGGNGAVLPLAAVIASSALKPRAN